MKNHATQFEDRILIYGEGGKLAIEADLPLGLIQKYDRYYDKKVHLIEKGRTTRFNDSKVNKVYIAENRSLQKFADQLPRLTDKEMEKAFKRIIKSKTYQKLVEAKSQGKGHETPILCIKDKLDGGGQGMAHYNGLIELKTNRTLYILLHELAHTAGHMHHDVGFIQAILKLSSRFISREFAKDLKKSFKKSKIKTTISTRVKTPLEWLEGYERLSAARKKL